MESDSTTFPDRGPNLVRLFTGAGMLATSLAFHAWKSTDEKRGTKPFIWLLLAITVISILEFCIWGQEINPSSEPRASTVSAAYILSVLLQIIHLTFAQKLSWNAYLTCWVQMIVFDGSLLVDLLQHTHTHYWTHGDLSFPWALQVRFCLSFSLVILFAYHKVKEPRATLPTEKVDYRSTIHNDFIEPDIGVLDDIRLSGGIWQWVKKFHVLVGWVLPWSASTWCWLVAAVVLVLCEKALDLYVPLLLESVLKTLSRMPGDGTLQLALGFVARYVIVGFIASPNGLTVIRQYIWTKYTSKRGVRVDKFVFAFLMRHEAAFHTRFDSGTLAVSVSHGSAIMSAFDALLLQMLPNTAQLIATCTVLYASYGSTITTLALFSQIAMLFVMIRIGKQRLVLVDDEQQAALAADRIRQDALMGWQTASQCGQTEREIGRYLAALATRKDSTLRLWDFYATRAPAAGLIHLVGEAICISLVTMRVLQLNSGVELVATFIAYHKLLASPLIVFQSAFTQLFESLCRANKLRRLLDVERTMKFGEDVVDNPEGDIKFVNVRCSHGVSTGRVLVFEDLNLVLEGGKTTAILGPSGSGKTTLLDLIQRRLDPETGSVRIGNQDLRVLKKGELEKLVSYMGQIVHMFNGTIKENIGYACPEASQGEIERAAKRAGIHSVITDRQKGYETVIGDQNSLSGGEKQRLALARVELRPSRVRLFDESTSSMDLNAEIMARKVMTSGKCTTIVAAHRLSSVIGADRIVVLGKDGKVVETGTHEDLIRRDGAYAQLWAVHVSSPGT